MTLALHPDAASRPSKKFVSIAAAAAIALGAGGYLTAKAVDSPAHTPKGPAIVKTHTPESPNVPRSEQTKPR